MGIIVVMAVPVKDADKVTLGQDLTVRVPHALGIMVHQPADWWLTNAHMTPYHTSLLVSDPITFTLLVTLNPVSVLLSHDPKVPAHN